MTPRDPLTPSSRTPVDVFPDPEALGMALAREIVAGIDRARDEGRRYILGCPGGRSGRSTYAAMAQLLRDADLSHLVIAMMDDYVEPAADGGWRPVPPEAHHSCRRFALAEIAGPLSAVAAGSVRPEHVWLPDPAEPGEYGRRLRAAGGVDLFIVASGASDGHVAFVRPGSALDSEVGIVELADSTRRDNLDTFPGFASLDEVPRHGVSVGLGTIRDLSRSVRLVIHGSVKRSAAERVLAAGDFDPEWPATFIHRCRDARILIDEAARPVGSRDTPGPDPGRQIEEEMP